MIAAITSVAFLLPAKIVRADENITIEYITSKVIQTKQVKLIGIYNEAYVAILKLPADIQDSLWLNLQW